MTYSYYPGCTLKTKAKDLDFYGRECARALGVELEEIEEWQCCGAVYPVVRDEIATKLSAVRALMAARDEGRELLTLCSACHHVLTRVNHDMLTDPDVRAKANNYLKPQVPYAGETKVVHYLQMLRDEVGFDVLAKAVKNPLKGRKIGAYYGCLLLRPSKVMAFDDPEDPRIIEDFIKALGATPVVYAMRNECCGGYVTLKSEEQSRENVQRIIKNARNHGAEELITACPLCMYNLRKFGDGGMRIEYITELLYEALGLGSVQEPGTGADAGTPADAVCGAGLKS
jgi:heterodisulfide reductase subunit B